MIAINSLFEVTSALINKVESKKLIPIAAQQIKTVLTDKATLPPGEARKNMFKPLIDNTKTTVRYWK